MQTKNQSKKVIQHKDKRVPTDKDLKIIEECTAVGYSRQELADELDMSKDLLAKWCQHYPHVSSAIRQGEKKCRKRAYACIYQQAFPIKDGKPTGKGDPKLIEKWIKCKLKWREPEKKIRIKSDNDMIPVIQYAIKEKQVNAKKEEKDNQD